MKLSSLSLQKIKKLLRTSGVYLCTGKFVSCIKTPIPSVAPDLLGLYRDYPLAANDEFADFHVNLTYPKTLRRWFRPQVLFYLDKVTPFKPLSAEQAFPVLEWGLNWCIASRIKNELIVHASVVEKNGKALIMPGMSGSGKSTLCAALICRGWRLLSDELTLINTSTGLVTPLPRPVSLKNESIEVIRRFEPEAFIGRISHDTTKGSVAHMRVPSVHVDRAKELARPAWVIFPKYVAGSTLDLVSISKGVTAISLIENSFNYSVLGILGFQTVTRLVEKADCYQLSYSVLDEAIDCVDTLVAKA